MTARSGGQLFATPNFQMPFPCGEVWTASTYSNHNAIDWNIMGADDEGRTVVASLAGTATATYSSTLGNYVKISHGGGWETVYAHLMEAGVSGSVTQGQFIGRVGKTGAVQEDAPHLHWVQLHNGVNQSTLYANGVVLQPGINYNSSDPSYTSANNCGAGKKWDYNNDIKADLAFFHPADGTWNTRNVSGGSIHSGLAYGGSADTPVAADYDGDGSTDIAVWKPSNGTWYVRKSTGGDVSIMYGGSADLPVQADYNGDKSTDIAVWKPSNGNWFVRNLAGGNIYSDFPYGGSADLPVPADYDGDKKADIAVWKDSNGTWYIHKSSTGTDISVIYGGPADVPVPADYDGDKIADIAVWKPSNGTWYIHKSTGGDLTIPYGWTGDIPVPADYDGDGKTDVAVWKPSNGTWYIQGSLVGDITIPYGWTGDIPQ